MKYAHQTGRFLVFATSILAALFLPSQNPVQAATDQPMPTEAEVLVVYNSSYVTDSDNNLVQDSQQIAEYYQSKRPGVTVTSLAMPTTAEITWAQYNSTIKTPLETYLTTNNLTNVIKIIVTVKGVPLKIMGDDGFHDPWGDPGCAPNCPVNYASVDAAISMLYQDIKSTTRHTNAYFNADPTFAENSHFKLNYFTTDGFTLRYLVSRLEAYTLSDVLGIIDRGAAANTTSSGYWILDSAASFHYDGFSTANTTLQNFHKNRIYDPYPGTIYITTSANPIIGYSSYGYLDGLGDGYISNTPANPNHFDFDFLNGAVISTWESFNAWGFNSPADSVHGQVAEWISIGGSGGIGNVYEPYTTSLAREYIWMPAYAVGYPWVEAAYMSMPKIGWAQTVIGDPLMVIADNIHPAAVTDLTATPTSEQIQLSWTNPAAGDYLGTVVRRKTGSYPTSPTDGTGIYDSTGTSYTDTGLSNGTTYYYSVYAYDTTYNYSTVAQASTYPRDSVAPGEVTDLQAVTSLGLANLHWDNPADADFLKTYIVRKVGSYPADVNDGTQAYVGTSVSFLDVGLTNNINYYYAAFAQDTSFNYSVLGNGSKINFTITSSSGGGGGGGGGSSGGGGGGGGGSSSNQNQTPINNQNTNSQNTPTATNAAVTLLDVIASESRVVAVNSFSEANEAIRKSAEKKYAAIINADQSLSAEAKNKILNFIAYGTASTAGLGEGERAGLVNSYFQAYKKMPDTEADCSDLLKIAHGRWPTERSNPIETSAAKQFKRIYGRAATSSSVDQNAIMVIAYGLLPSQRNLVSEKNAILAYRWLYGTAPRSANAWNIIRAIAYSGAKR